VATSRVKTTVLINTGTLLVGNRHSHGGLRQLRRHPRGRHPRDARCRDLRRQLRHRQRRERAVRRRAGLVPRCQRQRVRRVPHPRPPRRLRRSGPHAAGRVARRRGG
jgi:hypothetical protein